MARMPVLFIGHGSPMNVIEPNQFTAAWAKIAEELPLPKAILCISAHWYTDEQLVSGAKKPETIHDFYGFPKELFAVTYPAPGAPALAETVAALYENALLIDTHRGLDHGAWSVLHYMYPKADIPVCQLSVNATLSPEESYQAGRHLANLRDQGILILGSGNIVHNLSRVSWDMEGGFDWADAFDAYIKQAILAGQHEAVLQYPDAGASARHAFQTRDHFDPLLYVLGATDAGESVQVFNDARVMGSLSMTSYQIG